MVKRLGIHLLTLVVTFLVLNSCSVGVVLSRSIGVISSGSAHCTFNSRSLVAVGGTGRRADSPNTLVLSEQEGSGISLEKEGRRNGKRSVAKDGEAEEEEVAVEFEVKPRRLEEAAAARSCGADEDCIPRRSLKCESCNLSSAPAAAFGVAAGRAPSNDSQVLLEWKGRLDDSVTNALANWNLTTVPNFCQWKGIGCDNSTTQQHVVSITLAGYKLQGSIPAGLSELPFLTTLDLSFNRLIGDIPADLTNISSLRTLNLRSNHLNGTIPAFGNTSTSLQRLDLSKNKLAGPIPPSLGECTQLRLLNLSRNKLNGEIPKELGSLSNLQALYLDQNRLTGDLPPSLGNCIALINLSVGWNKLTGGIPDEYSNLNDLVGLYLFGNTLNGSLPDWLANLSNLTYLHLYYNEFSGTIPQLLGNAKQLISINLSNNSLEGQIPTALVVSSNLVEIDLSVNELSGNIIPDLGYLTGLQQLRLEQNHLTGPIPDSLRSCVNLTELVLSENQLTGSIIEVDSLLRLERLSLDGNLLTGTIPASLTRCTNLDVVDLSNNKLTGTIPGNIGLLKNLTTLRLSGNHLDGPLPELGALRSLEFLYLDNNQFTGRISVTLGNLLQLQVLDLGRNQLAGNIPEELSECVNLTTLALNDNRLNGSIPVSLGQLVSLQVLHLQGNRLSGAFPITFGRLTNLQDLDLSDNRLSGQFAPALLPVLSQLRGNFSLARNNMNGRLPQELGLLTLVQTLNLSGNNFTGTIPDEIGNCTSLVNLDLSSNGLTGAIPSSLGRLLSLQVLNGSHNVLSGSIPDALGSLAQLKQLDLTSNNLSGRIPPSFSNLADLVFFNVSDNILQGPVPEDGAFRSFTASSFLGNPGLCGPILLKSCDGDGSPSPGNSRHHKSSLSTGAKIGIAFAAVGVVALVCVSGFLFWRLAPWDRTPEKRGSIIARSEIFYPQLRFTVQDLKLATENFSEVNVLGNGSLSTVYRGVLPELVLVAVKKLKIPNGTQIPLAFVEELDELGTLRHRNLVAILGHCFDVEMNAIVVQFMSNGSLEEHLHRGPTCDLDWPTRAKICLGVAKALNFLHHDCGSLVVHCDLKPSNVLLDADLEPHLEDFGLSRLIFAHKLMEMTESSVGSSIGYFPPEYGYSPTVSPKGDVYSYGILLLELLTGRKPTLDMFKNGTSLTDWCQAAFPNKILDILDPTLIGSKETNLKQVNLFVKVALMCSKEDPDDRPDMKSVLDMLR